MQERHITQPGPVLDARGVITPGWSERSVSTYRRKDIKAPFFRIKEWDFYQISDGEKCLQFTFGHASYAGQVGVMLFNFKTGEMIADINKILALPFGSLHLPENAEADSDVRYDKDGVHLRFKTAGDTRYLSFSAPDFEAEVTLTRQNPYSLVIHIPFDEYKTAFYYNHKINCMTACGHAVYQGREYTFGDGAYGLLDWGAACGPSITSGIGPTARDWWMASCSALTWAPALATPAPPPKTCCSMTAAIPSWARCASRWATIICCPGACTMKRAGWI